MKCTRASSYNGKLTPRPLSNHYICFCTQYPEYSRREHISKQPGHQKDSRKIHRNRKKGGRNKTGDLHPNICANYNNQMSQQFTMTPLHVHNSSILETKDQRDSWNARKRFQSPTFKMPNDHTEDSNKQMNEDSNKWMNEVTNSGPSLENSWGGWKVIQ